MYYRGQIGPYSLIFWFIALIILAALAPALQSAINPSLAQFALSDPTRLIMSLAPLFLVGGVIAYLLGSYTGSPRQPNL